MSIKKKLLLTSLILLALYLPVQAAVLLLANENTKNTALELIDELHERDNYLEEEDVGALASSLTVFLTNVEDNLDDSLFHAAIALQILDTLTDVTLEDMEELLKTLRVDALYLTDMEGEFTVATVPGAVGGINLFEIWEGYRMLVTGEATELPSAIKVMVETGEIFKFTAIPRYDENGNIKGVAQSALEVSGIEGSMRNMIINYDMVNSYHLFEESGLTLLSVEKSSAKTKFTKGDTYNVPDIKVAFNSSDPLFIRPGDGTIILYKSIDRFGGPAYVMRLEVDETFYTVNTDRTTEMLETLQNHSLTNMLLIAVVGFIGIFIITGCYIILFQKSILKPVKYLQTLASRVSRGDITKVEETGRKDELGMLEKDFSDMVASINAQADTLHRLAENDYTANVTARSENDVVNNAIGRVIDITNDMLSQINAVASQVSDGANQLAQSAQMLAQGSTEQSASIEELSASIHEIADKTTHNTEMAENAATLASTIMQNAEKGSRQMEEMTAAVNEINEASQSISKVIKVIDDIAFQTNILALNASVEAARAGQHGKGFAVVAEEVRNLAAKSAEAAKETGNMIQNSREKTELGARIAGETASSLAEIVEGINKSTKLVSDIAKSSEDQLLDVKSINDGIDQVA
ncbi:MAG: methyl-accepting chemotaxis protein, partial [Oscillospiraceae bacterium]|nr:methyl-accepting chemotaxis protein [Oscillospiraceae bacterium]